MPSEGRCSQKLEKVGVGERNWRLTAQNEFGKAELSDTADLSKRGMPLLKQALICEICKIRLLTFFLNI